MTYCVDVYHASTAIAMDVSFLSVPFLPTHLPACLPALLPGARCDHQCSAAGSRCSEQGLHGPHCVQGTCAGMRWAVQCCGLLLTARLRSAVASLLCLVLPCCAAATDIWQAALHLFAVAPVNSDSVQRIPAVRTPWQGGRQVLLFVKATSYCLLLYLAVCSSHPPFLL